MKAVRVTSKPWDVHGQDGEEFCHIKEKFRCSSSSLSFFTGLNSQQYGISNQFPKAGSKL